MKLFQKSKKENNKKNKKTFNRHKSLKLKKCKILKRKPKL